MQQSVVTQQHTNPAPPAFATVLPMPQQLTPSHLADQMENTLHLSGMLLLIFNVVLFGITKFQLLMVIVVM